MIRRLGKTKTTTEQCVNDVILHYYCQLFATRFLAILDIVWTIVLQAFNTVDTFLTVSTTAYGKVRMYYDTAIQLYCSHK